MQLSFWRKDHPIIPTGKSLCDVLYTHWHIDGESSPQFTMLTELYVSNHDDTYTFKVMHFWHHRIAQGGLEMGFSLMPYGEVWRERRRAFTQYFHPGNADLYRTTQEEFLRKLLPRLLKDPENFLSITRQYVSQLPVKFELK